MDYNDLRSLIQQMHMHMRLDVLLIDTNERPWLLIVNDNARVAWCTDFESAQKEKEGSKHAFIASWKLKRKDNYYKVTIQWLASSTCCLLLPLGRMLGMSPVYCMWTVTYLKRDKCKMMSRWKIVISNIFIWITTMKINKMNNSIKSWVWKYKNVQLSVNTSNTYWTELKMFSEYFPISN